jgi:hypothetical protein
VPSPAWTSRYWLIDAAHVDPERASERPHERVGDELALLIPVRSGKPSGDLFEALVIHVRSVRAGVASAQSQPGSTATLAPLERSA